VVAWLDTEYAKSGVFLSGGDECAFSRSCAEIEPDRAAILREIHDRPTTNYTVGGHKLSSSLRRSKVPRGLPVRANFSKDQVPGRRSGGRPEEV
jgi:hypothetical protein